jgi:hypothetical protein
MPGYTAPDVSSITAIARENRETLIRRWIEECGWEPMKLATIIDVHVDDQHIAFTLSDGRIVAAPTSWSHRLLEATAEERADRRIDELGIEVEWPALDGHIGLRAFLGVPEEEVLRAAGFQVNQESVSD